MAGREDIHGGVPGKLAGTGRRWGWAWGRGEKWMEAGDVQADRFSSGKKRCHVGAWGGERVCLEQPAVIFLFTV